MPQFEGRYPAQERMKVSTAALYSASVGLCLRSHLTIVLSSNTAPVPPASLLMLAIVFAFNTTSNIPIWSPMLTHRYLKILKYYLHNIILRIRVKPEIHASILPKLIHNADQLQCEDILPNIISNLENNAQRLNVRFDILECQPQRQLLAVHESALVQEKPLNLPARIERQLETVREFDLPQSFL